MAPKAKVMAAFRAMKEIGIPESKTKPVLKKLLKMFDQKWEAIEAEDYRLLADSIFEYEETETAEKEKPPENAERGEPSGPASWQAGPMQDENIQDEPERPLKRLRLKHQAQGGPSNGHASPIAAGVLKIPKPEPGEADTSLQPLVRNKGKQPVSSHNIGSSAGREPTAGPGPEKPKRPRIETMIKPKDEPFTDDVMSIEPLAVILPEKPNNKAPSGPDNQVDNQEGNKSGTVNGFDKGLGSTTSTAQKKGLQEVDVSGIVPTKLNIAASTLGKVEISLTCNLATKVPDLEAIWEEVNDSCRGTYNIMDPDFSVKKLMKLFCDCVEAIGKSTDGAPNGFSEQDAHEM